MIMGGIRGLTFFKRVKWYCMAVVLLLGMYGGQKVRADAVTGLQTGENRLYRDGEVSRVGSSKKKKTRKKLISEKERDAYIGKSAFIGSSIGVGQKMYFNSKGKGFLGNPLVLARTSYSFMNDKNFRSAYMVQYRGVSMRAKDAIKKSGVKRAFICMGTNDIYSTGDAAFQAYREYLAGIRKVNPKVVVFIEAMPPVRSASRSGTGLKNHNIDRLNQKLEAYCKKQKDMYYIDINSVLKDKEGRLKSSYCSDNYCHLTFDGYAVWTKEVCKYVENLLESEKLATQAVKKAVKSKKREDKSYAKQRVKELEKSEKKDQLKEKIKKINLKD